MIQASDDNGGYSIIKDTKDSGIHQKIQSYQSRLIRSGLSVQLQVVKELMRMDIQPAHEALLDIVTNGALRAEIRKACLESLVALGINLSEIDLSGADLTATEISDAKGLTHQQLSKTKSLNLSKLSSNIKNSKD